MKIVYWFPFLVILVACNAKDNREGTHTPEGDYVTFSDSTSGWSARYPKSWPVLGAAEIARMEGRGEEALEDAAGAQLELSHRNLLWLKKDDFNSMTSNYQRFDPNIDGPYEETERLVTEVLETAYRQNKMQFDTRRGNAMLDGLDFTTWEAIIYTPDRSDTLMTQVMYMRLIDSNIALTLNINYGNRADRDTLLAIINSSKFAMRE